MIIVSTLPRRLSRWMAMDLPHRIRRATNLPVVACFTDPIAGSEVLGGADVGKGDRPERSEA
ncbi:MAG TPA: hypothetical protein VJ140_00820 [Actinomycetota bacterium]|nr:hypothetical protein [Actinomycetota bacterium]